MNKPELTAPQKEAMVAKLKHYFEEELDQEIGGFEAEFLIDFFARELGAHFYNRGLHDAHTLFVSRVQDLADAVYELERSTD